MGIVLSLLITVPSLSLRPSYLPVYAEVQEPYVYLQSSHVEVSSFYRGVPATAPVTLINGTLLPTRFHWGKVSESAFSTRGPGGGDVAPLAAPEQMLSLLSQPGLCPTVPRKAGPLKGAAHMSGLSLACLQGSPGPCLGRSLRCTQLDLPARDWSSQLLAAQLRHCPWGCRQPALHAKAEGSTSLCFRGSYPLLPITWASQGSLCSL